MLGLMQQAAVASTTEAVEKHTAVFRAAQVRGRGWADACRPGCGGVVGGGGMRQGHTHCEALTQAHLRTVGACLCVAL